MKVHEYNEMMAYMLRPRQKFAIGGGVIEGQGLGTREGFATIEKLTQITGIKNLTQIVNKTTGKDCGCNKRKQTLNRLFPYNNR